MNIILFINKYVKEIIVLISSLFTYILLKKNTKLQEQNQNLLDDVKKQKSVKAVQQKVINELKNECIKNTDLAVNIERMRKKEL